MIIQACVGSSCYLKGSQEIVEMLQDAMTEHQIENEITLIGALCIGKCNREGVTVQVDDEVHTGVTPEGFDEFFRTKVLAALK